MFVLAVVLTPPQAWQAFALYFVIIATLILFSHLPVETAYVQKGLNRATACHPT
jgi:hypothetical protein